MLYLRDVKRHGPRAACGPKTDLMQPARWFFLMLCMRPANGFNAAREMILQSIKIWSCCFCLCSVCCSFFDFFEIFWIFLMLFFLEKKIFFERLFFLEKKFSIMQSGPHENRFTPCGPWAEMSLTPLLYLIWYGGLDGGDGQKKCWRFSSRF